MLLSQSIRIPKGYFSKSILRYVKTAVVLHRVPDPKGGSFLSGGHHVKQNPRKGVLIFLEDLHSRIL